MKYLIFLLPLLAGCATPYGLEVRDEFVQGATDAYDESLANAEFWICKGASAGSVVRRYGVSDDQWDAWRRLCRYEQDDLGRPVPE